MKNNKGFTLIELMIVIAIIAIIAAIAIPNLMASRIRANEATAISGIKQIATAQVTFQAGKQGRNTVNSNAGPQGFCSQYRNLCFGLAVGSTANAAGSNLQLISEAVANAFITGDPALPVVNPSAAPALVPAANPAPYQGYQFQGDPLFNAVAPGAGGAGGTATRWGTDFAVFTVPAMGGTTGNNKYWVGQAGTVFINGVASNTAVAAQVVADSPQNAVGTWIVL